MEAETIPALSGWQREGRKREWLSPGSITDSSWKNSSKNSLGG